MDQVVTENEIDDSDNKCPIQTPISDIATPEFNRPTPQHGTIYPQHIATAINKRSPKAYNKTSR